MMSSCSLIVACLFIVSNRIDSQMVGTTRPSTTVAPCSCLSEEKLIDTMKEVLEPLTRKIADLEERLNDLASSLRLGPSELYMGLYSNLTIFSDWIEIYNKAYDEKTTTDELRHAAQQCRTNRVIVGAMENKNSNVLTVAGVGPTRVLVSNRGMYDPEVIENVAWYLESGRSFGFRPNDNDIYNNDRSELFLDWYVDVNYGGWRAGTQMNLSTNSAWRKVIYCMATF